MLTLKPIPLARKTVNDNIVFLMHYGVTAAILCLGCFLLSAKQYFGEAIACHGEGMPEDSMNIYCLAKGTSTIRELIPKALADEVAAPGIGYYDSRVHTKIMHYSYQWIPLVLALKTLALILPKILWNFWERKQLESLSRPVRGKDIDSEEHVRWLATLLNHFCQRERRRSNSYALKFFLCEMLNLVAVLLLVSSLCE